MQLIDQRWSKDLPAEARQSAEMVLDLDAEQTTCPACMTEFAPAAAGGRCPDCGLVFG